VLRKPAEDKGIDENLVENCFTLKYTLREGQYRKMAGIIKECGKKIIIKNSPLYFPITFTP